MTKKHLKRSLLIPEFINKVYRMVLCNNIKWTRVWAPERCDSHVAPLNGNVFRVIGPLCGDFTGDRWITHTKASDAELWCFLWSAPWIKGWVNNREAGDLRRHRAHYDVIVMVSNFVVTVGTEDCHYDPPGVTSDHKVDIMTTVRF